MQRARTEISKENRKQFILDCAEEIIIEKGLSTLNIASVSKKTKLAVGTIYIYFRDKEDIIAHLTIKSREVLLQKFIDHAKKKENVLEKIEELLIAFYFFYKENPFYNQLVSFYETNSGLQETEDLKNASNKITHFVVDIIKKGKEEKIINEKINENEFAFWLWGTTIGIIQLIEIKKNLLAEVLKNNEIDFYQSHIYHTINTLKKY